MTTSRCQRTDEQTDSGVNRALLSILLYQLGAKFHLTRKRLREQLLSRAGRT